MITIILITALFLIVNVLPLLRMWLGRWPWERGLRFLAFVFPLVWLGFSPLAQAVSPPPDGGYANQNTAEGEDALFSLTTGFVNTAVGFESLYSDTIGGANTAIGFQALHTNTSGNNNRAVGIQALFSNTDGFENSAFGNYALFGNTTGTANMASGPFCLFSNTTGY